MAQGAGDVGREGLTGAESNKVDEVDASIANTDAGEFRRKLAKLAVPRARMREGVEAKVHKRTSSYARGRARDRIGR